MQDPPQSSHFCASFQSDTAGAAAGAETQMYMLFAVHAAAADAVVVKHETHGISLQIMYASMK